jgi:hypothetical protein
MTAAPHDDEHDEHDEPARGELDRRDDDARGDPLLVTSRAVGDEIHALIAHLSRQDVDLAADLIEAVAVLECCAFEASLDRGRVRRRLCEIALVKAMLCRAALDDAVAQRMLSTGAAVPVRRALDAACAALAPLPRVALSELLRR